MGSHDLDRVSLLLGTYLFEALSPVELEPLARSATIRHMARGEYVHHVGDPADEIYLVVSGQLKDSIVTEDGDEALMQASGTRPTFTSMDAVFDERHEVFEVPFGTARPVLGHGQTP